MQYWSNKYNTLINNNSILHLAKVISNENSVFTIFTSEEYTNLNQILIYTTLTSNHEWKRALPQLNSVSITEGQCTYGANQTYYFYTTLYILNNVMYLYSGSSFYSSCTTNNINNKQDLIIDYDLQAGYVTSCNTEIYVA